MLTKRKDHKFRVKEIKKTYNEGLLFLPEPLLAEEDDGALEDEAHGVELQPLH